MLTVSSDAPASVTSMTSRRFLARLAAAGAAGLFVLAAAGPASADPLSDASSKLTSSSVYLEPGATVYGHPVEIDEGKVSTAFGSAVKVAVFADGKSAAELNAAGVSIAKAFGSQRAVLAVFSGNKIDADSNFVCGASTLLKSAASAHSAQLRQGNYTDALVAFAGAAAKAPRKSGTSCVGAGNASAANGSNSQFGKASDSSGGGSSAVPLVAGIGGLAVLGGGAYAYSKRRKRNNELSAAKANVMPYHDRLANEVNTLDPGKNAEARQALADASERYNSAGSQMATAATVAQWSAVRRTTLEGLQAAQSARKYLGLPPGPDVPPVEEPRGEQLSQAQQVTVQGQQYNGYPSYTPGAPYYYGGGGGYAGGWYNYPFWETMLIGSMIGGGGLGWGGGGYGAGYNSGYEAGEDRASNDPGNGNADNNSDGGWGGFGGGGDSGGGWGGFGGGDFGGGGGGDFGGGGGSDGGSF